VNGRSLSAAISLLSLLSAYPLLLPACEASSDGGTSSGGTSNSGGAVSGGAPQPTGGGAPRDSGGSVSVGARGGAAPNAGRDSTGGLPDSEGGGGASGAGGDHNPSGVGGDGGALGGGGAGGSLGDAGEGGAAVGVPSIATIMAQYRSSYEPQTEQPEPVSAYIFGLCRSPTLEERAFADSEHGRGRYLQDWANETAVSAIANRGQPPFAAGSVIVKEKYVLGAASGTLELAALGFMIKREPGFSPSHGDWDFAYWEPEVGVLSTAEQSSYCGGCHSSAADTDFVFIDGLKP
jgi:hypothetical protein